MAVSALSGSFKLFPVKGGLVVASEQAGPHPEDEKVFGSAIGYFDGKSLQLPKSWVLPGWFHDVVSVRGELPDKLTMLATGDTGRAPTAERYSSHATEGWKAHADCRGESCNFNLRYLGQVESKGSVAGLELGGMFPTRAPRFVTFSGPKLAATLTPAPAACKNEERFPPAFAALEPSAVTSLSDGSLLITGSFCDGGFGGEHWAEGASKGTLIKSTIDEPRMGDRPRLVPDRSGGAWLFDFVIARFEKGAFTRVEGPVPGEGVVAGALDKDGVLYVVTSSGLYSKAIAKESARWQQVELPGGAIANDVASDQAGTVWVTAPGALFRSRAAGEPDAAGGGVAIATSTKPGPKPKRAAAAGGPRCKTNLVVLYGFTKVTPDDYDFPLTRKAIKGHTELSGVRFVVSKDYGRKFFSGLAPSFDVAKKLAKLIEKEVKGSKPQIVCAEPEILRELAIDLKTGEVKK